MIATAIVNKSYIFCLVIVAQISLRKLNLHGRILLQTEF